MPGFERWFTRVRRLLGPPVSATVARSAQSAAPKTVSANGKKYAVPAPGTHIVLISADGLSQDHIDTAVARNAMPTWSRLMSEAAGPDLAVVESNADSVPQMPDFFRMRATHGLVSGAYPSLSEPNWACLVSGVPPLKTGITGSHALEVPSSLPLTPQITQSRTPTSAAPATASPTNAAIPPVSEWPIVDLSDASHIRSDSILSALASAGVEVTVLTASDSAARLLSHQLSPALAAHSGEVKPCVKAATTGGGVVVSLETVAALENGSAESAAADADASSGSGKCFADPLTAIVSRGLKAALHSSTGSTAAKDGNSTVDAAPSAAPTLLSLAHRLRLRPSAPAVTVVSLGDVFCPLNKNSALSPASIAASLSLLDAELASLDAAGCIVAVTSSHATVSREGFAKNPRVVHVADELVRAGAKPGSFRVILPAASAKEASLADAKHVGAGLDSSADAPTNRAPISGLSSCAMIYTSCPASLYPFISDGLRRAPGVYSVVGREDAAHTFDLPPAMIGDYVVIGDTRTVLGTTSAETGDVPVGFRACGAVDDATVPLWTNRPLPRSMRDKINRGQIRTYDALDLLLNGAATAV